MMKCSCLMRLLSTYVMQRERQMQLFVLVSTYVMQRERQMQFVVLT